VTNAGGPYTGNEGAAIHLSNASAVDDLNQSSVVVSWSINSPNCSFDNASVIHPNLTCRDNGSFIATLTASDGINPSVSSNATITVNNVAPTLGQINIPVSLNPVNATVFANANFTDPGSLDTHTATWDWGDGTTSAGTINETGGNGIASANHTYTVAGVYRVTLKITDKDSAVSNLSEFQFVVVYDPNGGFVTGGGQINSPAGALVAQPNVAGRGTFGFNAKYQRNGRLHSELEFELQGVRFHFHAHDAQWLVINGAQAQFQGTGTLEGSSHRYRFLLSMIDGRVSGGGGVDKLRLQIWDIDAGDRLVYDNQMGDPINAAPTVPIRNGNIVIHR
jgi:hypothetical protein